MRMEQLNAQALARLGNDRYLLCTVIFERCRELAKGAKPLVPMDTKKHKFPDIAIREIAEGKIALSDIEP